MIPGAGRGYEAEYLWRLGFKNVFANEFAPLAIRDYLNRVPDFPTGQVLTEDFFALDRDFDLIVEQTFLSALQPEDRRRYGRKCHSLLAPRGRVAGVLFNFAYDPMNGPPFGGEEKDYREIYNPFESIKLEPCYNSIAERQGHEFFVIAKKS